MIDSSLAYWDMRFVAIRPEGEIFRHGRKLARLIGAGKGDGTLLETQVELEPPDYSFDPFIQRHFSEMLCRNE